MPGDLPLLCYVFLFLLYYSLLLKILPVRKIICPDKKKIPGGEFSLSGSDGIAMDKIYRSAGFFLKHVFRTEKPCLRRALVLRHWCVRRGAACSVVVGVKKAEGGLLSHAWLEINSRPFRENPEILTAYTPIMGG